MPRRDDVQRANDSASTAAATAAAPASLTECTCDEYRRTEVCDHVLMAAAVRMVRRMIVIHEDDPEKPH